MDTCLGSGDGARPARDRHGLRDQRGLCLVAPGGFRAGGAREGGSRVHPHQPGDRPTYVDATVAKQAALARARLWTVATSTFKAETYRFLRQGGEGRGERGEIVVGGGGGGEGGGTGRRREDPGGGRAVARPAGPPAELGGRRMAEAADGRAAGDGAHKARLRAARMAEASASATKPSTPESMPARPHGSPVPIAGPRRDGPIWKRSSAWRSRTGQRKARRRAVRAETHDATPENGAVELHGYEKGQCLRDARLR